MKTKKIQVLLLLTCLSAAALAQTRTEKDLPGEKQIPANLLQRTNDARVGEFPGERSENKLLS